jgi:hypothetical protein
MPRKVLTGAATPVVNGYQDANGDWQPLGVTAGGVATVIADVATATPTVYNVTCTLANTQYSQALPTNCRMFEFQARTDYDIRFAFVTGRVATPTAPYMTLKATDFYWSPAINQDGTPSTLYVASAEAGTVVEIIAWV